MSGRRVRALKAEYVSGRVLLGDEPGVALARWQANHRRVKRAYRARKGA